MIDLLACEIRETERQLRAALRWRNHTPHGPGGENGPRIERERCRSLIKHLRWLRGT